MQEILLRRCGLPLRRTWIEQPYGEEVGWQPSAMELVMVRHLHRRTAHVFRAALSVPMQQLQLREGQDMVLVSSDDLLAGWIWSVRLGCYRPLADGLTEVMQQVFAHGREHGVSL